MQTSSRTEWRVPRARGWLGAVALGAALLGAACDDSTAGGGETASAAARAQAPGGPSDARAEAPGGPSDAGGAPVSPTASADDGAVRPSGARLDCGEDTWDFGTVYSGAVVEHTFALESAGSDDLVISKIKPSCGCTVADTEVVHADGTRERYEIKKPLPPGTRLELHAKIDTTGRRGAQNKPISIYCNDPEGVKRVTMLMTIEPAIDARPDHLRLGRMAVGETREGAVVLESRHDERLALEVRATELPAGFAYELVPRDPDAEGRARVWDLGVTLGPDVLPGRVAVKLSIMTDQPNPYAPPSVPEEQRKLLGIELLVEADVLDLYTVNQRSLFLGLLRPGDTLARTLRLNSYDSEHPMDAPEVRLTGRKGGELAFPDHFEVSVHPVEGVEAWDIELLVDSLPEEAKGAKLGGELHIGVANPDFPDFVIAFNGVCN